LIDVVVIKFREVWPTGIGEKTREIDRYLPDEKKTKFRLYLKLSLLGGLRPRPKSAKASPHQYVQSSTNFIQMGSLSAELLQPDA